jgi:flagellar biogenesis protein FliO
MKGGPDPRHGAVRSITADLPRMWPGTFRTSLVALWNRVQRISRRTPRRLHLCESLPLGERRFVAVVEFEDARFLVGGTASSMVLLSRLADAREPAQAEDEPEKAVNPVMIASNKRRPETC